MTWNWKIRKSLVKHCILEQTRKAWDFARISDGTLWEQENEVTITLNLGTFSQGHFGHLSRNIIKMRCNKIGQLTFSDDMTELT